MEGRGTPELLVLGNWSAQGPDGERIAFRSRAVAHALTMLVMQEGRPISRPALIEAFWPESDGDRQAQNYRRLASDLRDALGGAASSLVADREGMALQTGAVWCDAAEFLASSSRARRGEDLDLALSALALYQGPFLPGLEEGWADASRMKLEGAYGHLVAFASRELVGKGRGEEAVELCRKAIDLAPLREEIHVALVRTYRLLDHEADALRQFEFLEKLLDDHFGEAPSARATAVLSSPLPGGKEVARLRRGTVYIRRPSDDLADAWLREEESVLLVSGPRQSGKTTLLGRLAEEARAQGSTVAIADLQSFSSDQFASGEVFSRALARSLARWTRHPVDPLAGWVDWMGSNSNLDAAVEEILEASPTRVLWAFDEGDRAFGREWTDDFFGLLRSWHNRRALDPGGPWRKLSLLIAYSQEAHLFISDLSQSPFNVGVRAVLPDFTLDQTASATWQTSSATFEGGIPASKVPGVAPFTASVEASASFGQTSVAGGLAYADSRLQVAPDGPVPGSRILSTGPAWDLGFQVSHPLGGGRLTLQGSNLLRSRSYTGFGSSAVLSLSYQFKF